MKSKLKNLFKFGGHRGAAGGQKQWTRQGYQGGVSGKLA